MHSQQSLFPVPSDEISVGTNILGLVSVRINSDLSIIFIASTEQDMTDAVGTIDRLVEALQTARRELLRRAVKAGTFGSVYQVKNAPAAKASGAGALEQRAMDGDR